MPSKADRARVQRAKQRIAEEAKLAGQPLHPPAEERCDPAQVAADRERTRFRIELVVYILLASILGLGPSTYRIVKLTHWPLPPFLSWVGALVVIGRIIRVVTKRQADKAEPEPVPAVQDLIVVEPGSDIGRPNLVAAGAGLAYLLLVVFMWSPFARSSGMPYETAFSYVSETSSWTAGFVDKADPMRPYTNVFYHVAYLLAEAVRIPGSFVPFQFVYAALWWARGFLVFLVLRRVLRGSGILPYVTGALVLVHASDYAVQWVGQMNQFGYSFWMLLAIYLLIRAVQSTDPLHVYVFALLAATAEYFSLWSYESGLFIIILAPGLLYLAAPGIKSKLPFACGAWYSVVLVYAYLSIQKYFHSAGTTYQQTVMRSDWRISSLVSDLLFNVRASISFWRWVRTPTLDFSRLTTIYLALAGVVVFFAGGILVAALSPSESGRPSPNLAGRSPWVFLAAGAAVLFASFPVYLVLDAARSLWRTQLLSGIGAALVLAALTMLAGNRLSERLRRSSRWLPIVSCLSLASVVISYGAQRTIERGAMHRGVWENHRRTMASVLRLVPQVKPGTLFVLCNVPRPLDPFGDDIWFDVALRLAYPGTLVAGTYYFDDGKPGFGNSFGLTRDRWVVEGTGFPTLFKEAAIGDAIVIEFANPQSRVMKRIPSYVCRGECSANGYDPEARIIHAAPSPRAVNRYGPL